MRVNIMWIRVRYQSVEELRSDLLEPGTENRRKRKHLQRSLRKQPLEMEADEKGGGGSGAMTLWSRSRPFPATKEETDAVENAMERLSWEIYVLDAELYNQGVLLEEAEWGKVLDGEEKSVKAFEKMLEVKRRELDNLSVSIAGEEECLMDLNGSRNTIPTGLMRGFFQRPDQLSTVIEAGMDHLEEGLAMGSIYFSRDKREKLIDVLDMSVSFSEEDLESQRRAAQNGMDKAEDEMRLENYSW